MTVRHLLRIGLILMALSFMEARVQATPVELKDFSGKILRPAGELQVFMVLSPYCATSNTFSREFAKLEKSFPKAEFHYVISDAEAKAEDAEQWATLFEVTGAVVDDREQKIAKKFTVKVTPTTVVLYKGQKIYQGRISDWYMTPTRKKRKAEKEDLKEILDNPETFQAGETEAIGCELKIKSAGEQKKDAE